MTKSSSHLNSQTPTSPTRLFCRALLSIHSGAARLWLLFPSLIRMREFSRCLPSRALMRETDRRRHSGLSVQKNARNAWFTWISHKKQLYTDISLCFDLLLEKPLPSKSPHGFMNVFWLLFYRVVANWKSLAFYYVRKWSRILHIDRYFVIFAIFSDIGPS